MLLELAEAHAFANAGHDYYLQDSRNVRSLIQAGLINVSKTQISSYYISEEAQTMLKPIISAFRSQSTRLSTHCRDVPVEQMSIVELTLTLGKAGSSASLNRQTTNVLLYLFNFTLQCRYINSRVLSLVRMGRQAAHKPSISEAIFPRCKEDLVPDH